MKTKNYPAKYASRAPIKLLLTVIFIVSAALWQIPYASASTLFGEVIRANDSSSGTAYGQSISISGNTAAVSAWFGDSAVYMLQRDEETGAWQQTQKIDIPQLALRYGDFGFDVRLDNDQLIVGAPNILNAFTEAVSGYAFFYEREAANGSWNLTTSVEGATGVPGAEIANNRFGQVVAIQQEWAAISQDAMALDEENEYSSVRIFKNDVLAGGWMQTEVLRLDGLENAHPDSETADYVINSLAMDNNRLAVSVSYKNSAQAEEDALQLFEYNEASGSWIKSDSTDSIPTFGSLVGLSLDNNSLLFTGESEAFLFKYDPASAQWIQDANFSADVAISALGLTDIEGSRVVIAESGGTGATVYEQNSASGRWNEIAQLSTSLVSTEAPSFTSVDLSEDDVLLGTPYIDEFTGAVVAYRLDNLDVDDQDADGIADEDDNCPIDFNPTQANFDQDLLGDVCDLDDDNDGVDDINDAFPLDPTRQDPPIDLGDAPIAPNPARPVGNGIALETDFRWPAVLNASFYVIEVQHQGLIRAYELMITTAVCSDNQCVYVKSDAALEGANRWRLRAGNDAGISQWSPWADFIVDQPADPIGDPGNDDDAFSQLPAIPAPQQPVGDLNGVADYLWSAVPGAIEYSIEVQHQGLIRAYEPSIPASVACAFGQCLYTKSDAARVGVNRWRLRAINRVGGSSWSDWVQFSVSESVAGS